MFIQRSLSLLDKSVCGGQLWYRGGSKHILAASLLIALTVFVASATKQTRTGI